MEFKDLNLLGGKQPSYKKFIEDNTMEDKKKFFTELYNDCKITVEKLSDDELDELVETLENDAFEAKARLLACQDELTERSNRTPEDVIEDLISGRIQEP